VQAAQARVATRSGHWFPPSLVNNQFATLESPVGEDGVLRVDATQPVAMQCEAVLQWLRPLPSSPGRTSSPMGSTP
jgi:gluconokinase